MRWGYDIGGLLTKGEPKVTALNKILNRLICVSALAALIFTILLFQRRQELKQRADLLAESVGEIAETLDRQSGTHYRERAHQTPGMQNPLDPSQHWQGGSLGQEHFRHLRAADGSFREYESILLDVVKQAKDVHRQRNALASGLSAIAATLESEVAASELTQVANHAYRDPVTTIRTHVQRVSEREKTLIRGIRGAAVAIQSPIQEGNLEGFSTTAKTLNEFGHNLDRFTRRTDDYAATLMQAPLVIDAYDFQVNHRQISDEVDYKNALPILLQDFAGIDRNLNELAHKKLELEEKNNDLLDYMAALEDSHDTMRSLKARLANLEATHDIAYQALADCRASKPEPATTPMFDNGRIVKVDRNHNYVIIDLGARHNLTPNVRFSVARGPELICRITVSRILDDYAVCEILPEFRERVVVEGDRVVH